MEEASHGLFSAGNEEVRIQPEGAKGDLEVMLCSGYSRGLFKALSPCFFQAKWSISPAEEPGCFVASVAQINLSQPRLDRERFP